MKLTTRTKVLIALLCLTAAAVPLALAGQMSAYQALVNAGQYGYAAAGSLEEADERSVLIAAEAAELLADYLEVEENLDPAVRAEFLGYFEAGDDKMGLAALKCNQAASDIEIGDNLYWSGWTHYGNQNYGQAEADANNAKTAYQNALSKINDAWTLMTEAEQQYYYARMVLDDA